MFFVLGSWFLVLCSWRVFSPTEALNCGIVGAADMIAACCLSVSSHRLWEWNRQKLLEFVPILVGVIASHGIECG